MSVDLDFEPAYAVDQPVISFETLTREFSEFQKLTLYYGLQAQLSTRTNDREYLKRAYERNLELAKTGRVSDAKLDESYFLYQQAVGDVIRLQGSVRKMRASAEVDKLVLLDAGNPSGDRRKEIGAKLKEMVEVEMKALQEGHAASVVARDYFKKRVERGESLCKSGTLPPVECELRQLNYDNARLQLESVEFQAKALEQSAEAMQRTLKRLFEEHP